MFKPIPLPDLSKIELEKILSNTDKDQNNCFIWNKGKLKAGYGQFWYKNKGYLAHRVVAALVYGLPKQGDLALHSCDNPSCINPDHLRWGSNKENMDDMISRKRAGGEKHPRAKLTEFQVEKIRELYDCGLTQKQLAITYGITSRQISSIVNKKQWKNV